MRTRSLERFPYTRWIPWTRTKTTHLIKKQNGIIEGGRVKHLLCIFVQSVEAARGTFPTLTSVCCNLFDFMRTQHALPSGRKLLERYTNIPEVYCAKENVAASWYFGKHNKNKPGSGGRIPTARVASETAPET
eukprot:7247421-Pyramimonas_sp.AAC.1